MAALGSQSIASSYEQLLHVDADGGGNSTTHVSVKDGDNGTTFGFTIASDALMMSSANRLEFGDTGTYIHQSADGVLDLVSDTEIELNATTLDINAAVDISGNITMADDTSIGIGDSVERIEFDGAGDISVLGANFGIGTSTIPHGGIGEANFAIDATNPSIQVTDSGDDYPVWQFWAGSHDDIALGFDMYNDSGTWKSSDAGSNFLLYKVADAIKFMYDSGIAQGSTVSLNQGLVLDTNGGIFINDTENANMTQGLTINQGAADNEILAFKSSDVAHGMTNLTETDTWAIMYKGHGTGGGLRINGFTDTAGDAGNAILLNGVLGEAADTTKSTGAFGIIHLAATIKDGTGGQAPGSDQNLAVISAAGTVRFIFDAEGSFHADVESTTYDAYDDAQLVRAYDLSHGKGMIESKFDQFIDYNHETLADLKLVGREEDGTPNRMVNVTGMQHLHNGAIWQQYTEMQKMKELMYDTMVEMLGKEKADQKLTDHDIKLLDNKTLLN